MSGRALKIVGLVLGLVILAGGGYLIYNNSARVDKPLNEAAFPPTLQSLSLGQVVSGPQAIGMISKLHGSDIKIKQGYIAQYGGQQGQIMIWISESNNVSEAKQLFEIMDRKINKAGQSASQSADGPPFTDRRTFTQNGLNVVAVKGMDMENYYYQAGSKVYWVAAGGVDPIKTLNEIMGAL